METPPHETASIKCYARPSKPDQSPQFQRRILLKSDGVLGGCPENSEALEVVILKAEDYQDLIKYGQESKNRETSLNELLDRSKNEVETLRNEALQYNERTDQLNESYQKQIKILEASAKDYREDRDQLQSKYEKTLTNLEDATRWIGLSWGVLQLFQKKSRWSILFGGLDKSARDIPKPKERLLPGGHVGDVIPHDK